MSITVPVPPELHKLMRLWVDHGWPHCTQFQPATTTLFVSTTGLPFTNGNFTNYFKQSEALPLWELACHVLSELLVAPHCPPLLRAVLKPHMGGITFTPRMFRHAFVEDR